jgi:hypothetical protein
MSGTVYDDPNREAVGLDPIWTGAGEGVTPVSQQASAAGYDPSKYTVEQVIAYADAHPDEADDILAAEQAGKNRTTLVEALGG